MKTKLPLICLLLLAVLPTDASATDYYVDDSNVWNYPDGASWDTAFRELQEALYIASPGDRVFVAEGNYWPDWDPVTDTITNDRAASFHLKNGVEIVGGFPSYGSFCETQFCQTVLSGNIGGSSYQDNSYHVVTAGPGIDGTAVLQGVVIQSGEATDPYPNDRGGGMLIAYASPLLRNVIFVLNYGNGGAGMYVEGGAPTLETVTFDSNVALDGNGGGLWNYGGLPHLIGSTFSVNSATGEGGGLFNFAGAPYVERTRFVANSAARGGGLSNWPGSSTTLESVEMSGNAATGDIGGAIMNWQGLLFLNNVTLSANVAPFEGGGVFLFDANTVTIRNSIVWGNTGGSVNGALATVSSSIVQGGYPGTSVFDSDPQFREPGTNLRLKPASPAIDFGNIPTCADIDLLGRFRGEGCDMGAYQYLGTPGTYWRNGEAELAYATPAVATPLYLSVDDISVAPGTFCDVTSIRGMMMDGTKHADATFSVWGDNFGSPGLPYNSWSVQAHCDDNPGAPCGHDADCPGSWCVLPGQKFVDGAATIWEPRVDFFTTNRLTPGRYWFSMVGTVEVGSQGYPYWILSGESATQGIPYYDVRETGLSLAPGEFKNLTLDVDALCYIDADGDQSPAEVDCDESNPNRFPGSPEFCDGIDNNCDAIADTGQAPTTSPALFMTRTTLGWTPVANAVGYDIVSGSLDALRASGGNFANSSCQENDFVGAFYDIGNGIPHGLGNWYLVRAASPCGNSTYNDGSPSQIGSRDAEIAASGNACP